MACACTECSNLLNKLNKTKANYIDIDMNQIKVITKVIKIEFVLITKY